MGIFWPFVTDGAERSRAASSTSARASDRAPILSRDFISNARPKRTHTHRPGMQRALVDKYLYNVSTKQN